MKSVYTFLKEYKQLRESETSERAAELGYEWQRRNVYVDPKSGKRYRGTGTKFEEIPDEQPAEKKPGQQDPQKTLDKFKQDAQERPAVAPQTPQPSAFPANPADDGQEAEMRAVAASQGLWPRYTDARKDYHINRELQQIQADREAAQAELEAQQQPEPQPEPQVEEPPRKEPEEFRTIDQVIKDQNKNFDGSISEGDVDISTEESIQRVNEIANTSVDDSRFDNGRQSKKKFLDHYSQPSEYAGGLNTLRKSVAVSNNRDKVNELIDGLREGDYNRQIQLTKKESKSIGDLLTNAGIDINNQEEISTFLKAYDTVTSFIGDDGYFRRGETHELVGSNLGYYEAKHIAERSDLLELNPSDIQTKSFNLSSESESGLDNLDPKITDAVASLLPTPSLDFLAKSGSPKTFYDPSAPDQQGKTANFTRASSILHMWFMQDGKDAYTLSGQRRSPGEFQAEHLVPLKSGGKDHIDNFVFLLRRVNEPRADLPFDKFLEQARRRKESLESDLSNPKTRKEFETKYRSSSFNSELSSKIGGDILSLIDDSIFQNVNSSLESKLGKESSENLKFSNMDWLKYGKKINDFMDKNKLDRNAQFKDLNSDQMNSLFEIMEESLGLDRVKLNEYMGRNLFNNYDVGARHVIDPKTGKLERGRSGTMSTTGALLNMQNSILSDDTIPPDRKSEIIKKVKDQHQNLKKSRNNYIENSESSDAYEKYLEDILSNINYLTGGNGSPFSGMERNYDNRFTFSDRSNIFNDTSNAIMNLLSLDTASVSDGKDAFSPGYQKNSLTPKSKEYIKSLKEKLISNYSKTTGLKESDILNPDNLTKTNRKKIEPLINALQNIERGLNK